MRCNWRGTGGRCLFEFRRASPGGLLFGARAGEDARQTLIALVASVLENRIVAVAQRNHNAPGLRPCYGIVDRDFVLEGFGAGSREALDDVQLVAGVHE